MGVTITIKSKDDPTNSTNLFDSIKKDVKVTTDEIKSLLRDLGSETALQMILGIQSMKVRPQNGEPSDLEANINVENFEDGWGVGDISNLNEKVPYWAAINFGSSHMVGRRVPGGEFQPGEPKPSVDFFRDGRWVKDGGGKHWSYIVKNPIPAMNYIEKTVFWLDSKINDLKFLE